MQGRTITASWSASFPFGMNHQHPRAYRAMLGSVWENRDSLAMPTEFCATAVATVARSAPPACTIGPWTAFIFACASAVAPAEHHAGDGLAVARRCLFASRECPVASCASWGASPCRWCGERATNGFRRISWDEAIDLTATRLRAVDPHRLGWYLTSRGLTNEAYYAHQKVARFFGTNHIDTSARICHAPSTAALTATVGCAATTCSYSDWIGSDLVIFVGSNIANNQPVATKYLYYAKQAGTKIFVVNPYFEPGLDRYWVPSVTKSALFGTRIGR